jgi:hypothetical protein
MACGTVPAGDATGHTADAIVGGADDAGHPYVVAVGDDGGAFCSGTLVSTRTVVTSAQCAGGVTRVFFGKDVASAQAVSVARQVVHPNFSNAPLRNDVAALQLAADAPAQPVPLLRRTLSNTAAFVGPELTFVGFGVSQGATGAGFGVKRKASFPLTRVGPGAVGGTPGQLDRTQFYANSPGEGACSGDEGGPAFLVQDGVEFQAGLSSLFDPNCQLDGVWTRTDAPAVNGFLQARIDEFEPGNACRSDGACNEACTVNGQVNDADCAPNHCGADGACARACVDDPDCAAPPPPPSNSCVGLCGSQAPAGCFCDQQCQSFGDCCPDKVEVCGGAPPPPQPLVINELFVNPPGVDAGGFIELKGSPGASLAGHVLRAVDGEGVIYAEIAFSPNNALDANGYFVVAQDATVVVGPGSALIADAAADLRNGPDGLVLVGPTGATLDAIGYSDEFGAFAPSAVFVGEGSFAVNAPQGDLTKTMSRLPDGVDTNDNAADVRLGVPTPGAANVPAAGG